MAVSACEFLERFSRERMARGKTPAVLLLGSDVFWRDRCREKLVEACIPEGARDWGVARFSAAEVPLGRILHQAQTVPMLVPRQVVFVEEADVLDAAGEEEGEEKRGEKRGKERGKERDKTLRELAAYLDDPAPFTLLVFEASRLDQRTRFSKLLAEKVLVVQLDLEAGAAAGVSFELARAAGVEIDAEAAAMLEELLGGQLARVRIELEKLAAYVGERRRITTADVSEIVVSARTYSVWQLAEVLAAGPRGRALEFLDSVLRSGEAAPAVVGALAWMYRKLLEAQELPAGLNNWEAGRQLGMWSETAALALRQSRKIPREKLCAGLVAFAEADNQLKLRAVDQRAVLEFLVVQLTAGPAAPAPADASPGQSS